MSANPEVARASVAGDESAPLFPTETEIYLLADGRVVVADMPEALLGLVHALGEPEPCEVAFTVVEQHLNETTPEYNHPALPHD